MDNLYILRKPIEVYERDEYVIQYRYGDSIIRDSCDADDFERLFVPVSVHKQQLREQIEREVENHVWDIFNEFGWQISGHQLSESGCEQLQDRMHRFSDAIAGLVGLSNTEDEK